MALHADFERVMCEAPRFAAAMDAREPTHAYLRPALQCDYFAREAENRSLGQAGELFALYFERWRLKQMSAAHLAQQVRHVAAEDGDGLGYDILSFEPDGPQRFIEMKTTGFGEHTPFFCVS